LIIQKIILNTICNLKNWSFNSRDYE